MNNFVFFQKLPVGNTEDCLTLNLVVPKAHLDAQSGFGKKPDPLPIFLWIHGGGFYNGGTAWTIYNGTVMAAHQNVIFVAIQYRLGALGLAYLGTEDAPGNQGMWDQLEAIKWVYNNVAKFGGDPDKITIAGESAGAASVALHLLSPHSKPYIHQAVIESGSALSEWATNSKEEALERTEKLISRISRVSGPLFKCRNMENATRVDKIRCITKASQHSAVCANATKATGTAEEKLECLEGATVEDLLRYQHFTIDFV